MTFLVTLIALLIERFFDWSHLRHWQWFSSYEDTIAKRLPGQSGYILLAGVILPLLVGVGLVNFLLSSVLYGFIRLLFQLAILIYCFGPRNLWADSFACLSALSHGDTAAAAEKLKSLFGIVDAPQAADAHKQLLDNLFIQANRRIFAVIFWYVVLGPVGAVLYRTVILSTMSGQEASRGLARSASTVEGWLDWLPVRAFTFLFALGGHFSQVLSCWRKKLVLGPFSNDAMLTECGMAALGATDVQEVISTDGSLEKEAVSLLDRAFAFTLVVILVLSAMSLG